jgi:lipopolysaccharide/colanic/teichoic acid biosynthesis glycosyltransferase
VKRAFDILVSIGTLMFLVVPFALITIALSVTSAGPVFFKQDRVGLHGEVFKLFKFRSMIADAALIGSFSTTKDDPRITRFGRVLRRTSMDELPQLINVLMGDMSLVGPRPDVPAQRVLYSAEHWAKRHKVRPGITGLAQVNGRSCISAEARLKYDLEYAANPTFRTDFRILLRTIELLAGRGAN